MSEPKHCPLLKEPCITDRCAWWSSTTVTVEKTLEVITTPPKCAVLLAGVWAQMQFLERDIQRRFAE